MSKVVGIDLGTTNSLVAYVKDGVPLVIRDRAGDGLVPSVVSVAADGTVSVAGAAKTYKLNPSHGRLRRAGRATLKLRVPSRTLNAIKHALARRQRVRAHIRITTTQGRRKHVTHRLAEMLDLFFDARLRNQGTCQKSSQSDGISHLVGQ